MRSLKFKRLKILSDKEEKAIQFKFSKRFNLILAKGKNSVGKSTTVKNIFWCLGCEPRFDEKWDSLDCKALLEFTVGDMSYWAARHGNRLFFSENGKKYQVFSSVTGDFSEKIAKIVNFNALLPKRDEEIVITPPPAYYFLPFYIDQKHSWSNAWDSFDRLGQFANWIKEIIPYHVGITQNKYFTLTEEIYKKKQKQSLVRSEIERIDNAISVVNEFVPDVETTVSVEEFDEIRDELKEDVLILHEEQETLFENLASLRAEKAYIQSQLDIATKALTELHNDYEYSLQVEEELVCPTCGTIHDNSLVNRFSLLEDKDQTEQVVARLEKDLNKINKSVSEKEIELNIAREKIQTLNEKYYREEKQTSITLQNILDGVAAHSVKHRVKGHRRKKAADLYDLEEEEKSIEKDRKELTKENRKIVIEKFQEIYPTYTAKLGAFGVNSSAIKSPENHRKVAKSGGAAEGSRAMLAYYLSVYNLIYLYGEELLSPFVIDTPNQHEQAAKHYESIVALIRDYTPKNSQIFLCGMDSEKLDPLKQEGLVFNLEKEHSLLDKDQYKEIRRDIGWVFETIDDLD